MKVYTSPEALAEELNSLKKGGSSIGLVPTMGALHQGHLSLINSCKSENDYTVVSLFVNRLQFNNREDYELYPRPFEEDLEVLKSGEVDYVFAPSELAMYPDKPLATISFGELGNVLEGKFRPGHFDGVGVVVAKLFNITRSDRAYFGQKDLQQLLLVRRLVEDLSMQVKVVGLPIIREDSGLAMSSRNRRLTDLGKMTAAKIYEGLCLAKENWHNSGSVHETKSLVFDFYNRVPGLEVEYLEFVNPANLSENIEFDKNGVAICVAAYVEGVRLIDNLYLRPD